MEKLLISKTITQVQLYTTPNRNCTVQNHALSESGKTKPKFFKMKCLRKMFTPCKHAQYLQVENYISKTLTN